MFVTIRMPAAAHGRSTASIRARSNGSNPREGSRSFWTWANAMVRSAKHSKPRYRISPRSASSTAGSMRSPEYPAPDPMRMVFIRWLRSKEDDGGDAHRFPRFDSVAEFPANREKNRDFGNSAVFPSRKHLRFQ